MGMQIKPTKGWTRSAGRYVKAYVELYRTHYVPARPGKPGHTESTYLCRFTPPSSTYGGWPDDPPKKVLAKLQDDEKQKLRDWWSEHKAEAAANSARADLDSRFRLRMVRDGLARFDELPEDSPLTAEVAKETIAMANEIIEHVERLTGVKPTKKKPAAKKPAARKATGKKATASKPKTQRTAKTSATKKAATPKRSGPPVPAGGVPKKKAGDKLGERAQRMANKAAQRNSQPAEAEQEAAAS